MRDDIYTVIGSIRLELRAAQGNLARLEQMLASLKVPLPEAYVCPRCNVSKPNHEDLMWHLVNIHDDPQAALALGVVV